MAVIGEVIRWFVTFFSLILVGIFGLIVTIIEKIISLFSARWGEFTDYWLSEYREYKKEQEEIERMRKQEIREMRRREIMEKYNKKMAAERANSQEDSSSD